jgi:glutamate-1-semialdehyde aminotransferase
MFADTPSIWGHAPDDAFTQGVTDFIKNNGLCTMVPTGDAPIVAEMLQKLIDMKYWYVTLSASDSVRSSISIARIITGRRKVLIHNMGYLGLNEEGSYWKPVPGGEVVTRWPHYVSGTDEPATKVAEFNDLESVEEALKDGDVALFTTEAMMTDGGFCLAEPGYLQGCYELCQKYGTLFMIDETHTHTHSPRGLYNDMGLKADMWVTGKAIAGGIACGVLGMTNTRARSMTLRLPGESFP